MRGLIMFLLATVVVGCPRGAAADHPNLYQTPQDVDRAKLNIQRFDWAKEAKDDIVRVADEWAAMPPDGLRGVFPPQEAKFAYGFSGCPACGSSWAWWGRGDLCDYKRPWTVKCPSCGQIFPNDDYPDDGEGWLDPETGRRHWFVGAYNAYIAQTVTLSALNSLSNAYALTGDEKYAESAAVLFDGLARIYPTCTIGSIDYPNAPGGRLERTQYQVARVLVLLARYYDLIHQSPALDAASQSGEPTIRKSIEERILKDAAAYCFEQQNTGHYGLTNGAADYVRGVLAVGILLNIPEYVDWALEGPYCVFNFLENNLLRDGQYYETSVGYASHALNLYVDMAEMLANFRSEKYPDGINLYEHPKLARALAHSTYDVLCAGHSPRYGDSAPVWGKVTRRDPYDPLVHMWIERIYRRANEEDRPEWHRVLNDICQGNIEERRAGQRNAHMYYLLYNAEPLEDIPSPRSPEPSNSALLDGKGMAFLRTGSGPESQAALVRYGPSVCHGHCDELNLNFYALGRELTYDLGYSLGSAHVQRGWAYQTASHNLVMVNEKPQMLAGPSGGSAHLFAEMEIVRMAELSSENSYESEGVDLYRRTLALIDSGEGQSYLVDIFRTSGGETHDLIWHASGSELAVEGAELGEVQPGSLASPDYEWGSKIGPDGDITGQADKGPYWNAPPGNGFGFLYNARRGPVTGNLSATWATDADAGESFKISIFAPDGCEQITAKAPSILKTLPTVNYTITRLTGQDLKSTFTSVLQPIKGKNPVRRIEKMTPDSSDGHPAGIRVELQDKVDRIMSSLDFKPHAFDDGARLQGKFAFIRTHGNSLDHALLIQTNAVSVGEIEITVGNPLSWGRIEDIDYALGLITVSRILPEIGGLDAYISNPKYSRKSHYRVASIRQSGTKSVVELDTGSLILGKAHVGKEAPPGTQALDNLVPLEMACSNARTATGWFKGKLIRSSGGIESSVVNVLGDKTTILVPDASQFPAGSDLTIYDIQPGDRFEIPTTVSIVNSGGRLTISASSTGEIKIGGKVYAFGVGKTVVTL